IHVHAASMPQSHAKQDTVLPRGQDTDCVEKTVSNNEPQPIEKSVPDTVFTDNTVFSPMTEGECLRCGAEHVSLVQRHGRPACVGCSLLSDDELARWRPLMPTNGTHAPAPELPLTGETPAPKARAARQMRTVNDLPDAGACPTPGCPGRLK